MVNDASLRKLREGLQVVVPVALLRAKSRLGRALAVFAPLVAFHVIRLAVPSLVLQQPLTMPPGEVIYSINILLSLVLAWVLYSHTGDEACVEQPGRDLERLPSLN